MVKFDDILSAIIVIFGLIVIISSCIFFFYIRKLYLSHSNIFIIMSCIFLISITIKQEIILPIEIEKMDETLALHYHSIIVNLIFAFFTVVGIGITVFWTFSGPEWVMTSTSFFFIVLAYFLVVMYFIFYRPLNEKIKNYNNK